VAKERVFIVLMHKNSLKGPVRKGVEPQWEVEERVEFVNQIRKKHIETGTAIADYLDRKMVSGARFGMTDYAKFEEYVRTKYSKQMAQLDSVYGGQRIPTEDPEIFVDTFGNVRARTVFDPV
jgi:hypothetical protein